jgi:hypothetical protein
LISGTLDRRGRALFWSTIASAVLHVLLLALIFYAAQRVFITRGEREVVSQTRLVTIEKLTHPKAAAVRPARTLRQRASPPAKTPHHELAREVVARASPEPPKRPTVSTNIERDEAGFSREVAQLNAQNNPHSIPTIDPSSQESKTKSYQFAIPSSLRGTDQGNGIITPTRSWRESGEDCYYGRYEFTYPDGAMEYGDIVWPFCFDPNSDPFRQPPHPIPFPLPLPGFRLPADAQLPPIEKSVYRQWAAQSAPAASSTP